MYHSLRKFIQISHTFSIFSRKNLSLTKEIVSPENLSHYLPLKGNHPIRICHKSTHHSPRFHPLQEVFLVMKTDSNWVIRKFTHMHPHACGSFLTFHPHGGIIQNSEITIWLQNFPLGPTWLWNRPRNLLVCFQRLQCQPFKFESRVLLFCCSRPIFQLKMALMNHPRNLIPKSSTTSTRELFRSRFQKQNARESLLKIPLFPGQIWNKIRKNSLFFVLVTLLPFRLSKFWIER